MVDWWESSRVYLRQYRSPRYIARARPSANHSESPSKDRPYEEEIAARNTRLFVEEAEVSAVGQEQLQGKTCASQLRPAQGEAAVDDIEGRPPRRLNEEEIAARHPGLLVQGPEVGASRQDPPRDQTHAHEFRGAQDQAAGDVVEVGAPRYLGLRSLPSSRAKRGICTS